MVLVRRVFRRAFGGFDDLVVGVPPGDTRRAGAVADHLALIVAVLHHHHLAEDDLVWPKLTARVPEAAEEICRLESQHGDIDDVLGGVEAARTAWRATPDAAAGRVLCERMAILRELLYDHLDEEERVAVPMIAAHMTEKEWQEVMDRGASFLTARTLLRALVFGGLVLDAVDSEQQRASFLAGMPLGPRILVSLLGTRALDRERARMAG